MKNKGKIVWFIFLLAVISLSLATGLHPILAAGICIGIFNGFFALMKNIDENLPD